MYEVIINVGQLLAGVGFVLFIGGLIWLAHVLYRMLEFRRALAAAILGFAIG